MKRSNDSISLEDVTMRMLHLGSGRQLEGYVEGSESFCLIEMLDRRASVRLLNYP